MNRATLSLVAIGIVAIVFLAFGGTWNDGSGRKFALGRLTFWFVNVPVWSLLRWRFWVPSFHRVVKGDITRGFCGPLAFKYHPKEIA